MDTDASNNSGNAPQKYIRTFAGDVAVVQKGGTPDLTPLSVTAAPTPPEATASAPVAPIAVPPPAPSWDEKVREETLARLRAKVAEKEAEQPPVRAEVIPPPVVVEQRAPEIVENVPPPMPAPTPPPVERPDRVVEETVQLENPSPIHTYSGDFTDELKEKRASTATVLAAEQDAAPLTVDQGPQDSTFRKAIFLGIGAVLIIGGGAGAYYAYTIYEKSNLPVIIAPVISAPITVEEQEEISGEGAALMQAIAESATKSLPVGSIRQLFSTNATTTQRGVFNTLRPMAPSMLLRNIVGNKSMAGIINVGNGGSPFFILSVTSYSDTFAGMLFWESTMTSELASMFPPYPTLALAPAPVVVVPTTTSKTNTKKKNALKVATSTAPVLAPAPVFVPSFHDETIANHDVRVYRDALGQSVLLYGYWNQTTLIIARDAAAFTEILRRLANTHS